MLNDGKRKNISRTLFSYSNQQKTQFGLLGNLKIGIPILGHLFKCCGGYECDTSCYTSVDENMMYWTRKAKKDKKEKPQNIVDRLLRFWIFKHNCEVLVHCWLLVKFSQLVIKMVEKEASSFFNGKIIFKFLSFFSHCHYELFCIILKVLLSFPYSRQMLNTQTTKRKKEKLQMVMVVMFFWLDCTLKDSAGQI